MKKAILSFTAVLISGLFLVSVQKASAQTTTFGVKVGPNFSNQTIKLGDQKESNKILTNFQGGVYANLNIAPEFYIQPSLMYEGKGSKGKGDDADSKVNLGYLTLPIDFLFKSEFNNGNSWFIGVGPYLGYGISGKAKAGSVSLDPFKKEFGENGDQAMYKRFDAGANIQAGYELAGGFNVGVNANLGLINYLNKDFIDGKTTNTSFGVTLGYTLGK